MITRLRHTDPVVIHLEHCDCAACMPPVPGSRRALSMTEAAAWGIAGCVFGNAVAFVVDPDGAWHALAAAVAQMVGR